MRVISGTARGRKLREPAGGAIRPTGGKVKEAIFNIIQFDIEGSRVLDMFAGTGQLGIEALSRGAESAVFADSSPAAVKLIRENIELCGFSGKSEVHTADSLRLLERRGGYDIIFVDPPYDADLLEKAIGRIIEFDKLNTNGTIIAELRSGDTVAEVPPPYCLEKKYKYGSTEILRFIKI